MTGPALTGSSQPIGSGLDYGEREGHKEEPDRSQVGGCRVEGRPVYGHDGRDDAVACRRAGASSELRPCRCARCVAPRVHAVVEAKKLTVGPQGVLTQAERHSRGIRQQLRFQASQHVARRQRREDIDRSEVRAMLGGGMEHVGLVQQDDRRAAVLEQ
jgi:hypothetical protein